MPWVSADRWEEPECTLGWQIADWAEAHLRVPGGADYGKPLSLSGWQLRALADWYAVGPDRRWLYRRGQIRMAKGTGKSPFAAVVAIAELCGPVVLDGLDAHGDPVGKPRPAPWVQIAAVSEDQAGNTYQALHAMLADSGLLREVGVDLGVTRTLLRGRPGRLETVSASAGSREGQPITACIADETHLWTRTNGGRKLHATLLRNASKMGARILSTTNAWVPGDESVAEQVEIAAAQAPGIMIYGPQFEATVADITDVDALRAGLRHAYVDCPWVDVERILVDCQDPDMTAEDVARFHLNRPAASDAVLCATPTLDDSELEVGAPIALGFDGSRTRDATAVVAIHMETGVAHLLGYWERPIGLPRRSTWEVPRGEVATVIDEAFKRWRVVRMKADPSHWQDELAHWQQTHGPAVDRMPVWQTSIVDRAVEAAQTGLSAGALLLSSRPESSVLVAHVQRAQVLRRQIGSRTIRTLAKPDDATRIDAAAALVYASQARLEALAKGWEMTDEAPAPEPFVMIG